MMFMPWVRKESEKPAAHKPGRGYSLGHSFCLYGERPSQLNAQYRNYEQEVKRGFPDCANRK
jgi:hypothetical protein